jgi:iron(III) transport system permease protein
MKRLLLFAVLAGFVVLALLPVCVMVGRTVFVQRVDLSRGEEEPGGEGTLHGVLLDAGTHFPPHLTWLEIDVDDPLTGAWSAGDEQAFEPGEMIYFLPHVEIFRKSPDLGLVLHHQKPPGRSVLWSRGKIERISPDAVTLNVEKKRTLTVPTEALRESGIRQGDAFFFRTFETFSLRNYLTLFSDTKRMALLLNTAGVALLTVLLATLIGVVFAVALAKVDTPGRSILSVLYVVPLLIPPYISAIGWTQLLGAAGVVTRLWMSLFSLSEAPFTIYGVKGSVLVLAWTYFPIVTLLTAAGLRNLPSETEEAGVIAAGPRRTLVFISLRSVLPYILSGSIFVLIFTLANFGAPFILRTPVFAGQQIVAMMTDLSGAEAMTVGVPLVLLALGAVVLGGIAENRRARPLGRQVRRGYVMKAGPWRWVLFGFCGLILLQAVVAPLGVLIFNAGGPGNYIEALQKMGTEVKNSLALSFWAATAAALLGALLGYAVARLRSGGSWLDILLMLPFAAPAAVLGMGLIELCNRPGPLGALYTSGGILVWVYVVRFLPFAVKPVAAAVRSVDVELEQAAAVHGVPRWKTMLHGVLRLAGRGVVAGWILVFILSIGELDAALMVQPAGMQTMPTKIFNIIHFGRIELVSALCLILVFAITVPLAVYTLVTARRMQVA